MTLNGIIQAGIDILKQITHAQGSSRVGADSVLFAYLKSRRYIGARDRREISALVWDILRRRIFIEYVLGKFEPRMAVLFYLRHFKNTPASEIAALCNGEKYAPAKLTDAEEKYLNAFTPPQDIPPWVEHNTPLWLWQKAGDIYGERAAEEMRAMDATAPLDILVNPKKTTREKLLAHFRSLGANADPTPLSPLGIRIYPKINLAGDAYFRQGHYEIQDESSQIPAVMLSEVLPSVAAPLNILDYCAGAGGKSLGLSFFLGERAEIVATDLDVARLRRSRERFYRCGVDVKAVKMADLSKKYPPAHFDAVLIDAPCSCLGTMRRAPDIRWRTTPSDIENAVRLQREILAAAAPMVKAGGLLAYATCSITREENEEMIADFLPKHPGFSRLKSGLEKWRRFADNNGAMFRFSPASSQTDGFFIALLKKE